MSLSALFSKARNSSNELNSRAGKEMTRGREIVRGRLMMRKGNSSKRLLSEVVVYCASHDCSHPGQLEIFEEIKSTYQKPKKVISLIEVTQPGVQSGSPCTSLSTSPANVFATSPSSSAIPLWPFQLVLRTGEVFEFFAETPEDQRQWVKRLGLLLMFPYSPIPEEPVNNPIKDGFRAQLNLADYRADSVWPVYILPEEVGSRVNVLGLHVIALRSRGSEQQPGQLDVVSLADHTSPIVTWDRDKMRRTGCLGNMVFIEIGRRCRGGPGLVWMYAGPKDTAALRETLHTFLFKGDGRAVPISTQPSNVRGELSSRVSFDSGVPPSYPKRGSASSYQQSPSISTPQRQASIDSQVSDSGHPSSPFSQPPPPVHLHTHPSRRNSFKSYENVDHDSGISSSTCTSSRRSSTMSDHQIDGLDDEQFQLEDDNGRTEPGTTNIMRHTTFSSPKTTSHYQTPPHPIRSHTVSSPHPYQHSSDYEKMIHPRAGHVPSGTEEYVQMGPAHNSRPQSFRSLSDSPPKQLHPIREDKILSRQDQEVSNYENLSFQSKVRDSDFEYYAPQYENMEQFKNNQQTLHRYNSFSQGDNNKGVKSASPSSSRNVRHVETPSPPVIISSS